MKFNFQLFPEYEGLLFQQSPSQDKKRLSISEGSSNCSPSHTGPPKTFASNVPPGSEEDEMWNRHNRIFDSVVKKSFDIILVLVCKWILLTQGRENISYWWLYFKPFLLFLVTLIENVFLWAASIDITIRKTQTNTKPSEKNPLFFTLMLWTSVDAGQILLKWVDICVDIICQNRIWHITLIN